MSLTPDLLAAAIDAQQRGRRRLVYVCVPVGLACLVPVLIGALGPGVSDGLGALGVIGVLILLVGLAGAIGLVISAKGGAAVTRALRASPRDIVWAYGFEQRVNGQIARRSVILHTRDRASVDIDLAMIAPATADDVLDLLRSVHPDIVTGFSDESRRRAAALQRAP